MKVAEELLNLQGKRKFYAFVIAVAVSTFAFHFSDDFDADHYVQVIIWALGLFAGANTLKHLGDSYGRANNRQQPEVRPDGDVGRM